MILNIATALAMAALIWMSLVYAKPAVNLAGNEQLAQRIFYIHMGCNIGAFAAFIVSLVGSITYLISRNLDWDRVTQASIEVGTIIGLGTIITGSIWSKPTWNTYWTWDPRLTASTITVLIYVAYILFRNGIDNRMTKARFGSIYALFAFLSIPLTYYSARWFRSIHPVVFNGENADAQGGFAIGPSMSQTLLVATISFSLLFSALMIARWRQLRLQDRIEELREEVE
ncbi:MAG: cytochrome c biogenesis protein CcsA [Caldilineaceae bacterium]